MAATVRKSEEYYRYGRDYYYGGQALPNTVPGRTYIPEKPAPTARPKTRVRKKTARRAKTVYVHLENREGKISLLTMASVFYVFLGILACLLMHSVTTSKHSGIISSQNQLKHLQEYNNSLAADISTSYDLKEIERIATTKLGMSEPKAHQIIYVNVPKQSYAVQNESISVTEESETSFIDTLKEIAAYVFQGGKKDE